MSFLLSPEQHSGPVLGTSAASYPALFTPEGFRSQSHQKPATASSEEECSQAYVTLWWTPVRSGWQANLAIGQRDEWSNGLCVSSCPGNGGFYLAFRHTYQTFLLLSRISELIEIYKLQKDDPPGLLKLADPIKYSNACPGYNQLRFKKELKISIRYQSEHKLKKQQQRSQSSGMVKHSDSFTLPNQRKVPGAAYS